MSRNVKKFGGKCKKEDYLPLLSSVGDLAVDDDIEDSGYVETLRPNDVLVVMFEFSVGDLMADTQGTSMASP